MEIKRLMFQISVNVLDLLFIKPCIKKNVAFFQVSFILGMPHRHKPGAPEDDVASSFQPLNEPPDGLGACLSRKGEEIKIQFPS